MKPPHSSPADRPARQTPRIGDYRRGPRIRTTRAGTWFPALGPDNSPAGLLLVHPGVDLDVLLPTLRRLADLRLPGVLPVAPSLIEQAGRNWLVAHEAVTTAVAEVLDDGDHCDPGCAAAVLSDIGQTLLAAHTAGLIHGALSPLSVLVAHDGTALLGDWGTHPEGAPAPVDADVAGWAQLAELLAARWTPADCPERAELRAAVQAARREGLAAAVQRLRRPAAGARRAALAATACRRMLAHSEVRPTPRPSPGIEPDAGPIAGGGVARRAVPRRYLLPLVGLGVVALLAVVADVLLLVVPAERPASALDVEAVELHAAHNGTVCALIGVISTNGEAGTLRYGWMGDGADGRVLTETVERGQSQVRVSLPWSSATSPAAEPMVTLQVLRPRIVQVSARPGNDCL
jgi:hypothetical protein